MTIGEKIAKLRKQAGYSQETFSEMLGISRQAVSKWENGTATPTSENMGQIARLFGVPLSALLDDEDINLGIGEETAEKLSADIDNVSIRTKANRVSAIFTAGAVIVLAIAVIVQSVAIGKLRQQVSYLENEVSMLVALRSQVSSLTNYVYAQPVYPSDNSSEFTDYHYKIESYNRENDTAVLNFSVVPADYSRDTTAKIVIKGADNTYSADAVLENDIFTASAEVKCENNLAVYLYLTQGGNTRSFLLDYLPNPNTDYVMEIKGYGIEPGEKRYRMTDGAAEVNLQLWCDVAFSDKTYPKKAVIEMYADGNFVREFPYTSLMSAMEDREAEAYRSDGAAVSFGHQFTCYQYIQETVKNENIKKNSTITWKIIITDNNGQEYTAHINEIPVP